MSPVLAQFSINCAWSLQIVSGLSFLGLGTELPEPEWGLMVQQGAHYLVTGEWWVSFFPGMAIVAAVYSFQRFGVLLRDLTRAI
jgi:peptide/nickel transport system permease protein